MSWDYPTDSDRKREREEEMQYKGEEDCTGCTRCNRKLYFDEHGEPSACPDCTTKDAPPYKTPRNAQDVRQELVTALGTENQPVQWMTFMDAVTRLLPDILSPGRPSTEAIKCSPIGQLGFKSWQAMIEAPAELGGLAWNFSAWKAWRRAWATVQAQPWLRRQALTSSEINTLANDLKRLEKPFPGSFEALQEILQAKAAATEQKRSDTLTEAQREAAEARQSLAEMGGKLDAVTEQLRLEREANTGLSSEAGRLQAEVGQLRGELNVLRSTPPPVIPKLSRLEHLRAFLFGS